MFPARHAQILYPRKVAFPALERNLLYSLPKIEAIWDNQCPIEESFSQLKDLCVDACGRLKTIVPFVMLPRLTNLQEIIVSDCGSTETDFAWPTGVELFPTEITTFLPELKEMWLSNLPELKQTVLSSLELNDETVMSPKLTNLLIDNCCRLKNVFSLSVAKNLKHLTWLAVENCDGMQELVAPIGKGREESDGELFFPQLKKIKLENMKNLTKFRGCEYEEHHEEEIQEVDPILINQPLPFHSNKVFFPSLEELHLRHVGISPLDILQRAESFCNLRLVTIWECDASTLVSPNWLVLLHNLQELHVESCDEARELFDLQGLNAREQHVRLLSRISALILSSLPKLQSLWNRDPGGILDLQNLTKIKIEQCDLLKMLFSCSVVRTLEQLRVLVVKSCPMMETIVDNDDEGKEGTGDNIGFPRLKFLYLEELPMLSSFCNAKVALTMSSLKAARLRKCPQMLRFSSGGLHLPKMTILSSPARSSHVADLKEHLQASAIKINNSDFDDEELATDGEELAMDKDSDGKMDLRLVVEGLTQDDEHEFTLVGHHFY